MKNKAFWLLALLLLAAVMVACTPAGTEPTADTTDGGEGEGGAGEAPAECAEEGACAVYAPGEPIRIGFGGPLTGENSPYGIDSQQAAELAFEEAGEFEGHAFVLVPE